MSQKLSPQRHRDTEEKQHQSCFSFVLRENLNMAYSFCLSLCLCVSVVNAFSAFDVQNRITS